MPRVTVPIEHQEVLDRLAEHGIKPERYIEIKRIVSFDIPHGLLLFAQRFGRRSIKQVMAEVARWRKFLGSDALLTDDEKHAIARMLQGAEQVVCQALMDASLLNIGPWVITAEALPTTHDKDGKPIYVPMGLRIATTNRTTGERHSVDIAGAELNDPTKRLGAWKRAFEQLGIWDLIEKGRVYPHVMRGGVPRSWPTFTKVVIPRLYDYLRPHYQRRGHYSEKRDEMKAPKAQFQRELLEVMLLILRHEHPGTFEEMTINHIKADVQHHFERRPSRGTKTSK